MTLETIFNHDSDQDFTDGLRQYVRPFKSAYWMDENFVHIRSPSMWTSGRSVDSRPRPRTSDSDTVSDHILTRIKIFTVTISSGLKTSLTRPKVPQGNKSGAESPQKALLDYGKALPGYYSG